MKAIYLLKIPQFLVVILKFGWKFHLVSITPDELINPQALKDTLQKAATFFFENVDIQIVEIDELPNFVPNHGYQVNQTTVGTRIQALEALLASDRREDQNVIGQILGLTPPSFSLPPEISKAFQEEEDRKQQDLQNNPHNGQLGWWLVEGIRHTAHVRTTSAPRAAAKAHEAQLVGDWEMPTVRFLGPDLPDAF